MKVQVETIPIRRHGQAPSPFRERAGERALLNPTPIPPANPIRE